MKTPLFGLIFASLIIAPTFSHAGFADSLRDLRSSISQISGATKEASDLTKEVTGLTGSGSGRASGSSAASGQVLYPKINNVKLYQSANKGSSVVTKLSKGSEMVYSGNSSGAFHQVTTEHGDGWVEASLVQ